MRVLLLYLSSILSGPLLAYIALPTRSHFAIDIAIGIGLVCGFVFSPLVVLSHRRKRLRHSLISVFLVSGFAALCGRNTENPALAFGLTVTIFLIANVLAGQLLNDVVGKYPQTQCQTCGYLLDGIHSARCPECGAETSGKVGQSLSRLRPTVFLFALLALAASVVAATNMVIMNRKLPLDDAGLIGRLASDDIEVVTEVQLELCRRGKEPLITALTHGNPQVRTGAVIALGWLGDPTVVEDILGAGLDADPFVRRDAVAALANFDEPRVVEFVKQMLADPDIRVRSAAELTLRHPSAPGESDREEFNRGTP